MLKAEINDKVTKIEITGSLANICSDISRIISAINERITEHSPERGHEFKLLFTKGFMDGICFKDDREHMEHYLAEADDAHRKSEEAKENVPDGFPEFLDGFIKFLQGKLGELHGEDDNAAE